MLLSDRVDQLNKAIPSAISELGKALRAPEDRYGRLDDALRRDRRDEALELRLLAGALLAAAEAALLSLEPPPPPERHEHYHGPSAPL